jgi:serine/threonine-protein kinase
MGYQPGDRIGNYRVESELGPSGAGLLIQAHHLVLPRRVILKLVHPSFAALQPYVLQTLREACIMEAIAHPAVPVVFESGVLRDRRPWFALELITGPTLEEALAAGPLSIVEVAGLLRDLADVLEHAHRRGVIHRGLRPERVVITGERRFPLCIPDWSEAIAHDATAHLPPAASDDARRYVAPELAQDGEAGQRELIDDRVDMFALGVIAYRALTGELPFGAAIGRSRGPRTSSLAYTSAVELCRDRRPDSPPELAGIIDSLLAFDRFDRPSASEVRADMDWLFETLPALATARASLRRDAPLMQRYPAGQTDSKRGNVGNDVSTKEDLVLASPLRIRRPRWTPDVRYLETTNVDIKLAVGDDERIKD